jgi:hypothetical protein
MFGLTQDPLNSTTKDGYFDIVIGNPPYLSAVSMARTKKLKDTYKRLYPEATGAYDIYILFLLKGLELTRGFYTWIIPNKFLISEYAMKTKGKLISFGLTSAIDVSIFKVFENTNVYPIIIFGKNDQNSIGKFNEYELKKYTDLETRLFIEKQNIQSQTTIADFGIKVCSGATGFEAKKIKDYVTSENFENTIPFTVSGNIDRYNFNNKNVRYMGDVYKNAHLISTNEIANSKWNLWNNEKIIIAGMTKQIEATYVKQPLAIGVGVYAIYHFNNVHSYYILGLLNSKYTTYYLKQKFKDKHLAGGYLAINKSTIEQLPFKFDKAMHQPIISLVEQILSAKSSNPQADTSALEAEIDKLVYELYGLTKEEIKIIE